MRIVITGAAGLVGQNLAPLLLDRGHAVVALDKNALNLEILKQINPAVDAHCVDLSARGRWVEVLAGADAVVDAKAQITSAIEEPFIRNNVRAQELLLEACQQQRVPHLIYLSSSVVISVAEDFYTTSKRAGEALVLRSPVPFTALRPPLMFGCFDVKHLGWLAKLIRLSPVVPIPGSGRFLRQPLYVLDLCRVILSCLDRGPSGQVHNVIGHERIDFIDLLRAVARVQGLRRLMLPVPIPLFRALLATYGALTGRPPFTGQQLAALTAGDDFPVDDWTEVFGVRYTPFLAGLREAYASPLVPYWRLMVSPH